MNLLQRAKSWVVGKTGDGIVTATEPGWLVSVLGGGLSQSGVTVTPENALQVSAFFACMRILMEDVAKLPITVYQRDVKGNRREAVDDPLYRLFRKPNTWQTSFDFFETIVANLILHGNAYVVILRDRRGRPEMLIPYAAWKVIVLVSPDDGEIFYQLSRSTTHDTAILRDQPLSLPASEVIHIRCLNTGGLLGMSVLQKSRETLGLAIATETHGSKLFNNGAKPSGILVHPQILSEAAKTSLRAAWDAMHSGSSNWGKTVVLEEGMKYEPLTMTSTDAEWLESRRFQVEEIARMFRMPLFMLQSLQDLKYNTVELQNRSYYDQTLMPYLERIEAAFDTHFELWERNRYVEFDTNALLRADIATRYKAYSTGRQWGWLSANDVLRDEHKNEIGPQGDIYMVPANMMPADKWLKEPSSGDN